MHGFLFNDIIYGFGVRLGDGGREVDDKSVISCGFGNLIDLIHLFKISRLNSSITAAEGHWVMETSGLLKF